MGKTRDLVKKIRDTKGTFHAKISTIKDRNGMDLTEAEDIKKRWQEYTQELYKKDLNDPDNHAGVCVCVCVCIHMYICVYIHTHIYRSSIVVSYGNSF